MPRVMLLVVASYAAIAAASPGQAPASGDALPLLQGVIVADDPSAAPLHRARVSAQWAGGRSDPVYTDDRGRFAVLVTRSGRYSLAISKPGYAAQLRELDQSSTRGSIEVRLPRGAAITGFVTGRDGGPASDVTVIIRRSEAGRSGQHLTTTDDRGEFRVGSLSAGRYAVAAGDSAAAALLAEREGIALPLPRTARDAIVQVRAGEELSLVLADDSRSRMPPPGRETSPQGLSGANAAVIEGRVFGASARPLPGASVRVTHVETRIDRIGVTDANGRYRVPGLAAGTLRVVVVPLAGAAGLARGGLSARSVTMRPGERLSGVDFTFPAGAAVSGRIVDEYGEPLEGVALRTWRMRSRSGRIIAEPASDIVSRKTDDRGQYRLYGFPPGSYYLVATEELPSADPLARTGTALRRVIYPGVDDASRAVPLEITGVQDVFGVDMAFPFSRAARIYGRVVDSSDRPFRGSLALLVSARSGAPAFESRSVQITDGTFEFRGVPPGDYVLKATEEMPEGFFLREPGGDERESGTAFVTTAGADTQTLVRTMAGSSLQGRVLVEGDRPDSAPDVTVTVVPSDPDLAPASPQRVAYLSSEGTFELKNLSGPLRIAVTGLPRGWWLKSADIDSVNAADTPVLFGTRAQSRRGVLVVLSRTGGEVSGRVSGDDAATAGAIVLVFPTDPARWYARSRFLRLTTGDADGSFSVIGLPPEEYVVVAIESSALDPLTDEWQNPQLLSELVTRGSRTRLAEGARATMEVHVESLPR